MPFEPNPYDFTGVLDTSMPDWQKTGFQTIPTSPESAGAALGAISTVTADNSVASVCTAFRDATLNYDAKYRDQPGQAVPDPEGP